MFLFVGFSQTKTQEINSSKQVVENYFKYYNEKNIEKMRSTLNDEQDKLEGDQKLHYFENLKSIKLNSISEFTKPGENIITYKVEYTVKYNKENVGAKDSGKYTSFFTVVRKDKIHLG